MILINTYLFDRIGVGCASD